MNTLLVVFFVLAILLTIVAVVGHLIWVVAAAVVRAVTGWSEPGRDAQFGGRMGSAGRARPEVEFRRRLERLRQQGMISEEAFEEVLGAEKRYAAGLRTAAQRDWPLPAAAPSELPRPPAPAPPSLAPRPAPMAEAGVDEAGPAEPVEPSLPVAELMAPIEPPPSPTARSAQERAHDYMLRRTEAARQADQERHIPRPEPVAPAAPRLPWNRLLAAFLEEKNIRWGELVGGLLIVSGSVALVVSFWSAIAERPFLKFGVLNGVTASLFALGLYAARRWKLPTTSQGILLTSTLLVPLNFLAIAAFTEASSQVTLPMLAGELFSIGLFSTLVYFSATLIVPDWPWSLTIGVLVPCVSQLLMRRYVDASAPVGLLYGYSLVGLTAWLAVHVQGLRSILSEGPIGERRANELLKRLGLVAFALLVALGLLLVKTQQPRVTLQWLSPLSVLAAIPVLGCGILLWWRPAAEQINHKMAGAALLVAALLMLVAGFVLAWPQPALMTGLCVCCCLTLIGAGIVLQVPEAQGLAWLMLAPAIVLTVHVLTGRLTWTETHGPDVARALLSGLTGRVLTGTALVGLAISQAAAWYRRGQLVKPYAWASIIEAGLGLVLVCAYGFARPGDPEYVTWILGLYALVAIVVAVRACRPLAMAAAGGLLLGALIQGLMYADHGWPLVDARLVAPTAHALLMTALAAGFAMRRGEPWSVLQRPMLVWTKITSSVVVVLIAVKLLGATPLAEWSNLLLLTLLTLAVTWAGLAWLESSSAWFAASQVAFLATGTVWIDLRVQRQAWFEQSPWARLYPASLQWQAIWFSVFALAWMLVRRWLAASGESGGRRLPESEHRAAGVEHKLRILASCGGVCVDGVAAVLAGLVLVALAVYGAVPGIAQELSPRATSVRVVPAAETFLWWAIPHGQAHHATTWLLAVLLAALCVGYLPLRRPVVPLAGLAVVSATLPLLLATRCEATVAVASALRWLSAFYLMAASVLLWCRRPLRRWGRRTGWIGPGPRLTNRAAALGTLMALSLAPVVGMALFVGGMALWVQPPAPRDWQALYWTGVIGLVGCVATLCGLTMARQPRWRQAHWIAPAAGSVFVLGVAPLFAVTLFVIGSSLAQHPVVGPEPASWFSRIGLAASYCVPLLVTSVAVVGHAISYRSPNIALAGGLLLNASATAAYLLSLKSGTLVADQWMRLSQLNAVVAALYGLGWHLVAERLLRGAGRLTPSARPSPLSGADTPAALMTERPEGAVTFWVQRGIASGFTLLPIIAAMFALLVYRTSPLTIHRAADVWGWLGWLALSALWWISSRRDLAVVWPQLVMWPITAALVMVALGFSRLSGVPSTGWTWSLHAMQMAMFVSATLATVIERWGRPGWTVDVGGPGRVEQSGLRLGAWGLLPLCGLIVYSVATLPHFAWMSGWKLAWAAGGLTAAGALSTDRGWLVGRQRWWFLAALLCNVAVTVWWIDYGARLVVAGSALGEEAFVCVNVVVLAGLVPLWVFLGRRRALPVRRLPSIQGVATALAFWLMFATCAVGLMIASVRIHALPQWLALVAMGVACVSTLWDGRLKWSGIACYLFSLLAVGTLLDRLNLPTSELLWSGTLMLAVHGVATSYVWSRRQGIWTVLERWGAPSSDEPRLFDTAGIVVLNSLLAAFLCWPATVVQLTEMNPALRLAVSQAVLAQSLAVGLLAHGRRATTLRYYSLLIAVGGAILFGWSWLSPTSSWLDRTVVAATALMGMAVFYAVGLIKIVRRDNDWTAAASRLVPPLIAAGTVTVMGVLVAEVIYFATLGQVPIARPAMVAVAVALVASAVACLIAAVVPGRDPLGLSEKQRMGYVYAAEALSAILFAHLRVCVPELFGGVLQRYWTLIVMGIAFLGVGLSEFFRRRRQEVLAVPLERTGVVMPLLPMIGFWVGSGDVHLSLIMLAAGGLYAALSVMRRSFGFGVLAALVANGGLWYFLQSTAGIQFFAHPQLWLIPPAFCVLAAGYLNRRQLDETQMTSIRYLTSAVIYTSSTADIFINGVAEAPWLPFVLAGLSLVGIFAGIMLRVRAFLFLGLAFLSIALFTVIWHAAVDLRQTWLWYVTAIVAGVLIIGLFAVFERKRNDVLRVVNELKSWER